MSGSVGSLRWSVGLPTDRVTLRDEFGTAPAIAEMAAAIEAAGFAACHVTDHPFPPAPWVAGGGHHTLDPLVTLAVAGTATATLRLFTNVYVVAYRNPFLAAHGIATLDSMTDGRMIVGVAGGYLEGEFAAVGADFAERGARLDAGIAAMKAAWRGEPVHLEGPGWSADGNVLAPVPATQPHPPIWVGGNARVAIRRAVRSGQGWMPFPASRGMARAARTVAMADLDDLAAGIAVLHGEADRVGRTEPLDICFSPFSLPFGAREIDVEALAAEGRALADLGVSWASISIPATTRAQYLGQVAEAGAVLHGGAHGLSGTG